MSDNLREVELQLEKALRVLNASCFVCDGFDAVTCVHCRGGLSKDAATTVRRAVVLSLAALTREAFHVEA